MEAFAAYQSRPGEDTLVALLKAHQDSVYNICYRVLRHPQNAQDAAQQVLIELLKNLPKIQDGDHLKLWLSRAAFHVSLDAKKALQHRREREARVAQEAEQPVLSDSEETVDAVHAHVARLDDDLRTLVVDHYFDQKSLGMLATERGCSTAAVWKKLERAREKLRESIAKAGYAMAVPGLENVLTSIRPVSAPEAMLSKVLMSKAAGGPAKALLLGGIAMKLKTQVAAVLLLVVAAAFLTGVLIRRREERRLEAEAQQAAEARAKARAKERPAAPAPKPKETPPAPPPAVAKALPEAEEIPVFKSLSGIYAAFRKACFLREAQERSKALHRMGILLSDGDFAKIESKIRSRAGTEDFTWTLWAGIFKQWQKEDLKGYVGFWMRNPLTPPSFHEPTPLEKLGTLLLDCADHEAAFAYAQTLTEAEGRSAILNRLRPSPEAVAALKDHNERMQGVREVILDWGTRDPRAASQWLGKLTDPSERSLGLVNLSVKWGQTDLVGALAWVQEQASEKERLTALKHVLISAAGTDPKGAILSAVKMFDVADLYGRPGDDNRMSLLWPFRSWAEADPQAAAGYLSALPAAPNAPYEGGDPHAFLSKEVGARWALVDPAAALEWARQLEGEERRVTVDAVCGALVKSVKCSPDEALSMIDKLPEDQRKAAREKAVSSWAEFDPVAAAAFARSHSEFGTTVESTIAGTWAGRDLDAAMVWARGLPRDVDRDASLNAIFMASKDSNAPQRNWEIAREIGDPKLRDNALGFTFDMLLKSDDVQQAMELTREISDPESRHGARSSALDKYVDKNSVEVGLALLNKMADVSETDYGRFALKWASKDPAAAWAWATSLPKGMNEAALLYVFPSWARTQPDAALAWVEQAPPVSAQTLDFLKRKVAALKR